MIALDSRIACLEDSGRARLHCKGGNHVPFEISRWARVRCAFADPLCIPSTTQFQSDHGSDSWRGGSRAAGIGCSLWADAQRLRASRLHGRWRSSSAVQRSNADSCTVRRSRFRWGPFRLRRRPALKIVVQDGDPAPGGGALFLTYEYSLNSLGDVVFGAYTSLGDHLVFLFSQDSLSLLARQGDPAPRGGTFRRFHHPVININRQVAFGCDLEPSGYGIFLRSADGSMTEVVREGDPAPGGEPLESSVDGAATLYPGSAEINDAGAVAFSATASIYGRGGIFLFSNGQIMPQIRENDPAPGGGVFSYFSNFSLNSAGQIAFQASDTSTNGVFLFSGGAITEVVRTGERSPEGDRFVYFAYSTVSLSAVGQVTFES